MFTFFLSASPEPSEPSTPQKVGNGSKRRFSKKLVVAAAVVLVVGVVCAFLFSNSSVATVPLSLNYEVGEQMVYSSSWSTLVERYNQTLNVPATQTTGSNSTLTMDVLSLNGDTYTLNNTYNFEILGKPFNTNMTQQLTKADYVNNFLIGDAARLLYNLTGDKTDYYKLNLLQATIGESIQIPVNTGNESIGTTGTLNVKFAAIEDITVPAGTFKVFRLDYTADFTIHANLQGILNIQLPEPVPGQITGQTYLEYGTCRLIKSAVTETDQFPGTQGYNCTYTSERTLTQFTKP
jgi:hypothetical protein